MNTGNEFLSWAKTDAQILMMGTYGSGRTTILDRINGSPGEELDVIVLGVKPTRQYGRAIITPLEVGGRNSSRALYRKYLSTTDAIIYVLDEHEDNRTLARREMHGVIQDMSATGVPILIVANKQDLHPNDFTELMEEKLMLNDLKHDWHVVSASALHSDEGLHEGLEWLDRAIYQYKTKSATSKQQDKSKVPTEKRILEQFAKNSLASIKKLFLINVDTS